MCPGIAKMSVIAQDTGNIKSQRAHATIPYVASAWWRPDFQRAADKPPIRPPAATPPHSRG